MQDNSIVLCLLKPTALNISAKEAARFHWIKSNGTGLDWVRKDQINHSQSKDVPCNKLLKTHYTTHHLRIFANTVKG